jgi:hypothetical protein
MKCKLCNKEKNLLKRSHIIPDFMYNGLFNEKHFIAPLDLLKLQKKKLLSNGIYDSNILCEDCDNKILGTLESYSRIVIWGGKGNKDLYPTYENKIDQLNQKFIHLENLNYSKFKLFLLSIIWRASISRQKIFDSVLLGDEHEKKIGKMIYENNPGESDEYPVGLFILTENDEFPTKIISNPIPIEDGENISYMFLINGLVINFKIQGEGDKEFYNHIKIKDNNTMDIYLFEKEDSKEFLDNYLKKKLRYNHFA